MSVDVAAVNDAPEATANSYTTVEDNSTSGNVLTDSEVATLSRIAQEFGWQRGELREELEDGALGAAVRAQFESSREYGTNALPSLLIEDAAGRALLLGGYADSTTIVETTRARLAARAERR